MKSKHFIFLVLFALITSISCKSSFASMKDEVPLTQEQRQLILAKIIAAVEEVTGKKCKAFQPQRFPRMIEIDDFDVSDTYLNRCGSVLIKDRLNNGERSLDKIKISFWPK